MPLKFRLSTLLLLITVAAVSICWWLDHADRSRRDIVGVWYFPNGDFIQMGYRTTLEIREDGTFTKTQDTRGGSSIFNGTYVANENGTVTFIVEERIDDFFFGVNNSRYGSNYYQI